MGKRGQDKILFMVLILVFLASSCTSSSSSSGEIPRSPAEENFYSNESKFYELVDSFNLSLPNDKDVSLLFHSDYEHVTIGITKIDPISGLQIIPNLGGNSLPINGKKVEEILQKIGWTLEDLMFLKICLTAIHCIGISNGNPTVIVYQEEDVKNFSSSTYEIFMDSLSQLEKAKFRERKEFSILNERVLLRIVYPL